jgi:hypothetical protein
MVYSCQENVILPIVYTDVMTDCCMPMGKQQEQENALDPGEAVGRGKQEREKTIDEALAEAVARGKKGGRKPVQREEPRVRMASRMYGDPRLTVADICQTLRISPATFYRYIALGRRAADSE